MPQQGPGEGVSTTIEERPGTLEWCCYFHWHSRANYRCWCSSSPAGYFKWHRWRLF
ncbi:hypothetical protein ZIOFF_061528 [Zingiber officinale]|uniref:Uncharacterized protein n=1 Tax=Zingiber officinale TaxID=94328 RepID=A0A8J5F2C7_ZINOF|nr:hypothetical protein ZIOFF_061528 [Zingiber officinale]